MKYILWPIALIVVLLLIAILVMSIGSKSRQANIATLELHESTHADLADFLYEFAKKHRLSVQWFGWYADEGSSQWYARADRIPTFSVRLYMLDKTNGDLSFSSYFNELNKANYSIDYGSRKADWLEVVADMEDQLQNKGWLARK